MSTFRQLTPEKILEARTLTPAERQAIADDNIRFNTNVGLLAAVLLGLGAVLLHCMGGQVPYWSAVGAAAAAFGAALGTGGVLGFLFGVPGPQKGTVNNVTNAGPGTVALATGKDSINAGGDIDGASGKPPAADTAGAAPLVNAATATVIPPSAPAALSSSVSNLEQVADWVAKLLLGGGLTQMQRIPPKIWSWSRMVALGILGPAGGTEQAIVAQQAFSAGLLVYGFILGFFSGFLITKLQLGKAIANDPVN